MGNINLNNVLRKRYEERSPVDKSIVLKKDKSTEEIYSDLKFDLEIKEIVETPINATENNQDLVKIIDEDAVLNSLRNILSTKKCSRILNPDVEINVGLFLFEPIDQHKAHFIGYLLFVDIPVYEPRVQVNAINVVGYPEEKLYEIFIQASIPSLNRNVNLTTILNIQEVA